MSDELPEEMPQRLAALERHLAKVPAEEVSDAVATRIGRDLEPLTWRDRFVGGFMALSSAAALYILVAVIWQLIPAKPPPVHEPPPMSAEMAMQIKELKELALIR